MICQLATVVWYDAWVEPTEFVTSTVVEDTHAPWEITTTGWLLQSDDKGVSIANEWAHVDGHDRFRGRTFIPKGMIKAGYPKFLHNAKRHKKTKLQPIIDELAK